MNQPSPWGFCNQSWFWTYRIGGKKLTVYSSRDHLLGGIPTLYRGNPYRDPLLCRILPLYRGTSYRDLVLCTGILHTVVSSSVESILCTGGLHTGILSSVESLLCTGGLHTGIPSSVESLLCTGGLHTWIWSSVESLLCTVIPPPTAPPQQYSGARGGLRFGRLASCGDTGGLSCSMDFSDETANGTHLMILMFVYRISTENVEA